MEYKAKSRGWAWKCPSKAEPQGVWSGNRTGRVAGTAGFFSCPKHVDGIYEVLWASVMLTDTPTFHTDPNQKQGDLWRDTSRATQMVSDRVQC